MTKVKGHCTAADVRRGLASHVDKLGNDAADALAVVGALASDKRLMARKIQNKIALTIQLHRMMVDILTARQELRTQFVEENETDGSSSSDDSSDSSGSSGEDTSDDWSELPPD